MRAKFVFATAALSAALLSLTSCIVGVGDWERFSKDFHSSYPLKAGGRLTVETFNGSVDISGWDRDTVDINGTKYGPSQEEADNLRVDMDASPDSVSIRVPRPTERRNNQGARLVIKIPRNTQLDRITTSNSSIRTEDGAGSTRLRTSNGSIRVVDLRGDLEAETSNAPIELCDLNHKMAVLNHKVAGMSDTRNRLARPKPIPEMGGDSILGGDFLCVINDKDSN